MSGLVLLDREVLAGLMWSGVAAGAVICMTGLRRARTESLLMGMTIAFYSLTGLTYVPLIGSPASPLPVIDRMWGAMTAVIAGGAVLGIVATTRLKSTDADAGESRRAMILVSLAAATSMAVVFYSLHSSWELPPSSDFLNSYGDRPGVVIYQTTFALWIGVPAGALGIAIGRSRSFGWPRRLVGAGGALAVVWAVWKVAGISVVAAGLRMPAGSPVSVATGISALVLCVSGLAAIRVRAGRALGQQRAQYAAARRREDQQFGRHRL